MMMRTMAAAAAAAAAPVRPRPVSRMLIRRRGTSGPTSLASLGCAPRAASGAAASSGGGPVLRLHVGGRRAPALSFVGGAGRRSISTTPPALGRHDGRSSYAKYQKRRPRKKPAKTSLKWKMARGLDRKVIE